MHKYPKDVAAAAKLLDSIFPKWFELIDLDIFDMSDCNQCILGQLLSDYTRGFKLLFPDRKVDSALDEIFGDDGDATAWEIEIKNRLPKVRFSDLKPGQTFKCERYGEELTFLNNKNVKLNKPYYLFYDVDHNLYGISDNLIVEPFKGM